MSQSQRFTERFSCRGSAPIEYKEDFSLERKIGFVRAIASDGTGVIRTAGEKVKFVPFVLSGEEIVYQVVDSRAHFERARLVNVIHPSTDRVQPPCAHFGTQDPGNRLGQSVAHLASPASPLEQSSRMHDGPCGSCQLQHASLGRQKEMKVSWLLETCLRIGKWANIHNDALQNVLQFVALQPLAYRHRARFHLGPARACNAAPGAPQCSNRGCRTFGYQSEAADGGMVDLQECQIVVAEIAALIPKLREVLTKHLSSQELAKKSFQVELTRYFDSQSSKALVALSIFNEGRDRTEIHSQLLQLCLNDLHDFGVKNPRTHQSPKGNNLHCTANSAAPTPGTNDLLLVQPDRQREFLCETPQSTNSSDHKKWLRLEARHLQAFLVHRLGFLQPHCQAASVYRKIVEDMIKESGLPASSHKLDPAAPQFVVWDLYAGCGLFTESILGAEFAPSSIKIVHVELSKESVAAAKKQYSTSPFEISFEAIAVSAFLKKQTKSKHQPQLVIVDPPRSGLGLQDARLLANLLTTRRAEDCPHKSAKKTGSKLTSNEPRPHLIMIFCDPAAFARDTAVFLAAGYTIQSAFLIDAFPQTKHYECLVHLC